MSTKIKSEPSEAPSEAPTAPFRPSVSKTQSAGVTFARKEGIKTEKDVRRVKVEKPVEVIVIEDDKVDIWSNLELPKRPQIFNVPKSKPVSSIPVRVSCGGLGSGPGSKDDWVDPSKYFDINQSVASKTQEEGEEEEWGTYPRDGPIHYDPNNESSFVPNPLYKAPPTVETQGRLNQSNALKRRAPGPEELKDFYPVDIEEVVDDIVPGVVSGYRKR